MSPPRICNAAFPAKHPLAASWNRWLEALHGEGAFSRLLAARGYGQALLDGFAEARWEVPALNALDPQQLSALLAGYGPLRLFRGQMSFAVAWPHTLRAWARFEDLQPCRSTPSLAAVVEGGLRDYREILRTMEAFEHAAFSVLSEPSAAPSAAAGWWRVVALDERRATLLRPASDDPMSLRSLWCAPTLRRLRTGDWLWAVMDAGDPAQAQSLGPFLSAAASPWMDAAGWPLVRFAGLPTEVAARFGLRGHDSLSADAPDLL